jgi:hypothetical protein
MLELLINNPTINPNIKVSDVHKFVRCIMLIDTLRRNVKTLTHINSRIDYFNVSNTY